MVVQFIFKENTLMYLLEKQNRQRGRGRAGGGEAGRDLSFASSLASKQ